MTLQPQSCDYAGWRVLTAAPGEAPALAEAVRLAGMTLAGHVALDAASGGRIDPPPLASAVLIDVRGLSGEALEAGLDAAQAGLVRQGCPVVAALGAWQVDAVSSAWLGAPHQLLHEPTVAEIAIALVSAHSQPARARESGRDDDDRLRRLNAEVARIAEALAQLTRADAEQDRAAPAVRDRATAFRAPPSDVGSGHEARQIRKLIRARRMRDAHFPGELFADPAWDILLDLFAAELDQQRVSVSSLCIAAAVPGTTALRWIGTMIDTGLLERHADAHDRRRAYISLSERARTALRAYFEAIGGQGLSVI